MYGWEHKVEHMPTQLWEKQGEGMVHAKFMKQMNDTNTKVLHAGEKCPLTSLDDFVAKHGKQRVARAQTHCATQGASQPQSDSGSCSGSSSEDGNDDIAQVDEVSADGARDTDCCSQASSGRRTQQRLEVSRLCTRKLAFHDRSIDQEDGRNRLHR